MSYLYWQNQALRAMWILFNVYRHVSFMILMTSMNFLWKVKISELFLTRVSQTGKQLMARSDLWSSMSSTYAAHMPLVIFDACKSGSVTRESGAKDSCSATADVNHSCLQPTVTYILKVHEELTIKTCIKVNRVFVYLQILFKTINTSLISHLWAGI